MQTKRPALHQFLATTLLLLALFTASSQAITIAKNASPTATIITDTSIPTDKHAANELATLLKQITGSNFPIKNLSDMPESNRILVGTQAAKTAHPNFTIDDLGYDGIAIQTINSDLILAGQGPRASHYAAYTFLEDNLNCRFLTSTVNVLPPKKDISFDTLNHRYTPPLEFRESFWFDAFDGNFAVRNKCNGHAHRLSDDQGGKHIYEGFVHTFYKLIPPATYFQDHPEWFSLINGKRSTQRAQLCLTNQEMKAQLIANLRERLRKNPKATIASVSQNDWHGNCQCPNCKAIDEEQGSPAGLMIMFANDVAHALKDEFPNVAVSTLAYQYTRKPPKTVTPDPSVIVQLCSIECSFSHPLNSDENKKFRDDLLGWSKICNRLYIWDYTTNFRHYFLPHPNFRVLQPNIDFFVNHGVKGVFEQGAYTSAGADNAELRAWVLAKLLWNPNQNPHLLVKDFTDHYYGPAAGPLVQDYLTKLCDKIAETNERLICLPPTQHYPQYLSLDMLLFGWDKLTQAESLAKDNPDYLYRLEAAKLPLRYAFIRNWDEHKKIATENNLPWPMPDTKKQAVTDFKTIAQKHNVTRICEWYDGFKLYNDTLE